LTAEGIRRDDWARGTRRGLFVAVRLPAGRELARAINGRRRKRKPATNVEDSGSADVSTATEETASHNANPSSKWRSSFVKESAGEVRQIPSHKTGLLRHGRPATFSGSRSDA